MAWGKAGSTTKTSAGAGLAISGLTASKQNVVLTHQLSSTSVSPEYRLDSNSNTDYAWRKSGNGGTDLTVTSDNNAQIDSAGGNNDKFAILYFCNVDSKEKLAISFLVDRSTAGAGTAPNRTEGVSKCDTTTNTGQFTAIDVETGGYVIGIDSNVSALGSELTPASATTIETGSIYIDTDINGRWWYDGTNWNMQPTYQTDFSSSTGWTTVGSNITITGGVIQASSMVTQTNNRIYYDLGSALSDKFVIDFDHYADTASAGGYWQMFALTDTTAIPRTDDAIHALVDMGSWTTYLRHVNEGSETNVGLLGNLTAGQWQYVRFVRDGTTGTLTVYSDSDRTTQVLNVSGTIPATVTGLRYFQSGALSGANAGTTTYKIDNLKIYNGVTSVQE